MAMGSGIFGSQQQVGFNQGKSWTHKQQQVDAEKTAAAGLGAAVAGIAAMVQAKKEIAALVAVRKALAEALAEAAPNHPLNNKDIRNQIYESAYDEA
jgi:fructose-1-phosphate kinase PfkB-like protein